MEKPEPLNDDEKQREIDNQLALDALWANSGQDLTRSYSTKSGDVMRVLQGQYTYVMWRRRGEPWQPLDVVDYGAARANGSRGVSVLDNRVLYYAVCAVICLENPTWTKADVVRLQEQIEKAVDTQLVSNGPKDAGSVYETLKEMLSGNVRYVRRR